MTDEPTEGDTPMSDTAAEIAERLEDSYSRRSSTPFSGWQECDAPDRSFRTAAVVEVVMPLLDRAREEATAETIGEGESDAERS